jgi:FeS assembly SUF system regulator
MIRLNRMTDYAIVILGQMAQDVGRVRTAAALAEATGVPVPTVSKILKIMGSASLVTPHRGAKGGYSLDRDAAEVTVTDIVQALEGPIALTACVDGAEDACEVENLCPMRGNWNRVNDAIRGALDKVSLGDMLDPNEMFPIRTAPSAESATAERLSTTVRASAKPPITSPTQSVAGE